MYSRFNLPAMTKVGRISPSIQGNYVIARRACAFPGDTCAARQCGEQSSTDRRLLRAKNTSALPLAPLRGLCGGRCQGERLATT